MADYSDYKECTDCVHYELCLHQEKFLIEHNRKDLIRRYGFGLSEPEICCNFRDRSQFVKLPCAGDKVYEICCINPWGDCVIGEVDKNDTDFDSELLGKRFFLTPEEAEKALKERENNA